MITMKNILKKLDKFQIKAFTLIESLLTLGITCFMLAALSGGVSTLYRDIQENLFLIQFENFYRDTQHLSVISKKEIALTIDEDVIRNKDSQLRIPKGIRVTPQFIYFNTLGGNSSLGKIYFKLRDKTVYYQLYLGNGNFKKKTD